MTENIVKVRSLDLYNANVSVYSGKILFIHVDLKDQSLDTIKKLGRGNYISDSTNGPNNPHAEYKLDDIFLSVWQR